MRLNRSASEERRRRRRERLTNRWWRRRYFNSIQSEMLEFLVNTRRSFVMSAFREHGAKFSSSARVPIRVRETDDSTRRRTDREREDDYI